jgi:DNA polymerase III subunit gamma/tau
MYYTALYRKLRPKTFGDVIGQEFVIKTLINQIQNKRISHAYLFCGTRGTGKTSVAKIFAKTINCTSIKNGEPCLICSVCTSIAENRNLNVYEIDAASNNGIENIREIREDVKYPPTIGSYKVYIIDEVHMLSTGAFNALLKTLEEPPAYVIFILATTDPQKIPATILSRCQRFDFKRILSSDMFFALKQYSKSEAINIEDSALKYITQISDGAMRDALSILDICSSFYLDTAITYEDILKLVGSVDNKVFVQIAYALSDFNSQKTIDIIADIVTNGRDITQFVNDLLLHFRNLLISLSIDTTSNALDYSIENILTLKEQAKKIGTEKIFLYINTFSKLQGQIKYSTNLRILLEVTCIKLCTLSVPSDTSVLEVRLKKLEDLVDENNFKSIPMPSSHVDKNLEDLESLASETKAPLKQDATNTHPLKETKELQSPIMEIKNNWSHFCSTLTPSIKNILQSSTPIFTSTSLTIIVQDESALTILKDESRLTLIKQKINDTTTKEIEVIVVSKDMYDKIKAKNSQPLDDDLKNLTNFTDTINMNIIIE